MNLCNIHVHTNAERKEKVFSIHVIAMHDDVYGNNDADYQCSMSKSLSKAEMATCKVNHCMGPGSCLSPQCSNPVLRVETPVFSVVNDSSALNFMDFAYVGNMNNGYHQAKALPVRPLSIRDQPQVHNSLNKNARHSRIPGAFDHSARN